MYKFFGFKVMINRRLNPVESSEIKTVVREYCRNENIDLETYLIYLHQLIILAEEEHFGVSGGLPGRVSRIKIEFSVNQKQIENKKIRFVNHVYDKTRSNITVPYFKEDLIGYEINSEYFSDSRFFQNSIITFVDKTLPRRHEKVKVGVTADPTPEYRLRLNSRDLADKETKLDLLFEKDIQLLIPGIEEADTMNDGKPSEYKGAKNVIYNNYGTTGSMGENALSSDFTINVSLKSELDALLKELSKSEKDKEHMDVVAEARHHAHDGNSFQLKSSLARMGLWGAEKSGELGFSVLQQAIFDALKLGGT